jgi:hypothetical protein
MAHYIVTVYGDSGRGKSIDMACAFANALFIGNPRGLQSAERFGIKPVVVQPSRLVEVPAILQKHKATITGLVFDDLTLFADKEVNQSAQGDLRKLYGGLVRDAMNALAAADSLGVPVGVNAHQREPGTGEDGIYQPGGPDLPGKKLVKKIPADSDLVLRVVPVPERMLWPYGYHSSPSVNPGGGELDDDAKASPYLVKSRLVSVPAVAPMNLAEILRHNGRPVPRLRGMEWAEGVVEKLAVRFAGVQPADRPALFKSHVSSITTKYNATPTQLAWVVRDALDRADLRAMTQNPLAAFGING